MTKHQRIVIVNRWFRSDGQKKIVDQIVDHLFFNFWEDAEKLKDEILHFNSRAIVKYIRDKYQTSLTDARDMMVAFVGHYNNDKQSIHFTLARYDNGIKLWESILRDLEKQLNTHSNSL